MGVPWLRGLSGALGDHNAVICPKSLGLQEKLDADFHYGQTFPTASGNACSK